MNKQKVAPHFAPAYVPPAASGVIRPERLEAAVVAAGLARSYTAAKSFIKDCPPRYAELLRLAMRVAPDRLAVITQEVEAVMDGCDKDELTPELVIEETARDGRQDDAFEIYRQTPKGPERTQRARAAAHEAFRHGRLLMRLGRAILRAEELTV